MIEKIENEKQKSKSDKKGTVPFLSEEAEGAACPAHGHSYGGQAVIEGVMMRGRKHLAIAVRKPDGEIVVKKDRVNAFERSFAAKVPVLRGVVAFFGAMVTGVKAITYSAEFFEEPAENEKTRFDRWLENKLGERTDDFVMVFSVVSAVFLAALLFFILPTVLISLARGAVKSALGLNILEGLLRITMFVAYVLVISRMKDIQRVFEYHGAEHKTIFCYEHGRELTVENAAGFSPLHPRCGTSFIVFVLVISIVLFSFVGWPNPWMRILYRFILLPVVAGISYELLKWAGKSDSPIVRILSWPGLMFQRLTTREPDEEQIEVAIASLKAVLAMEAEEKEEAEPHETEEADS